MTVLVDGVATSVDYLKSAGYDVKFTSFDKDGKSQASGLFASGTATSTDGKIAASGLTAGDKYQVQVVISYGSTVLSSELANIEIANLDNTVNEVKSYSILATDANENDINIGDTLVVGEEASFDELYLANGKAVIDATNKAYTVTSSNPSVISVGSDNKTFTAKGLGTATLTVKYGNATKQITLNVKGDVRKPVEVKGASVTSAIVGGTSKLSVNVVDQYGDAYSLEDDTSKVKVTLPSGITTSGTITSTSNYEGNLTFDLSVVTKAGEQGILVIKDANDKTIGSFTIKTTDVNNKDQIKLEYATSKSTDDTISAYDESDNQVAYALNYYSSEGVANGRANITNFTTEYDSKIITVTKDTTNNRFVITPATNGKAGTTKFAIYDGQGKFVAEKSITVSQGEPSLASATFKDISKVNSVIQGFNYAKVFEIDPTTDPVFKGIKLSDSISNAVRLDTDNASAATGTLYIDKNDDGNYTANVDAPIGTVEVSTSTDSNSTLTNAVSSGNFISGYNIAAGAKGTIVYTVKDLAGNVKGTKAITVDVKDTTASESDIVAPTVTSAAYATTPAVTAVKATATSQGLKFTAADADAAGNSLKVKIVQGDNSVTTTSASFASNTLTITLKDGGDTVANVLTATNSITQIAVVDGDSDVTNNTAPVTATTSDIALAGGVDGVAAGYKVTVNFSEAISVASQSSATFVFNGTAPTISSKAWAADGKSVVLTLSGALDPTATTVTVTGAKDAANNAITAVAKTIAR